MNKIRVISIKLPKIFILIILTILFFSSGLFIRKIASETINQKSASIFFSFENTSSFNKKISLNINAGTNKIAFVHTEIVFDQTKIKLSEDPQISDHFKNIIQKTSIDEANTTGRIILIAGLSPDDVNNPPTGTFQIGLLSFSTVVQSGETNLALDSDTVQIVDITGEEIKITSDLFTLPLDSVINMNFINSPKNVFTNQSFTTDLNMDTNNFEVVGADLIINYDKDKLKLNSIDTGVFTEVKNQEIDNTIGQASITIFQNTIDLPINGNNLLVLKLHFTALVRGIGNINLLSSSVIAGPGDIGQVLTVVPGNPVSVSIIPEPTPLPTSTPIPVVYKNADLNEDGHVDIADYLLLFENYNKINPTNKKADVNGDGLVNIKDYAILYDSFEF